MIISCILVVVGGGHCMECLWSLGPLHSLTTTVRPFNVALERVSVSVWADCMKQELWVQRFYYAGHDQHLSGPIAMVLNL